MSALRVTPDPASERVRIMTPSQAAERYLDDLARAAKAAGTIHRYRIYLYELADMYPHVDVEDLTPEMWRKWLDRICKGRRGVPLDRETISQRVGIAKRFTAYLRLEGIIKRDPLERIQGPKRQHPVDNDKIVWLTADETQRMLAVAARDIGLKRTPQDRYRKMLCLGVLAYTGGRRAAVSELRIKDYDGMGDPPTLAFHEKGGKYIKKPVARRLADLLREAQLAGVWSDPDDYLIPSVGKARNPKRDSRAIYHLVKEVAADAKVTAHVHALRAAFAVHFLENNPDQLTALKNLMGHSQTATTEMYLRRLDRQKGMEVVVDLDWGAQGPFHSLGDTEKEGFEPSIQAKPLPEPDGLPRETER